FNFKEQGKSLKTVKQVQFHLATVTDVQDVKIIIRQGGTLASSTVTYTQDVTEAKAGWNNIDLSEPYNIEPSLNLYVGYEVNITSTTVAPISVAAGTEQKQSWLYAGEDVVNYASQGANFLIKTLIATEPSPPNEIVFLMITSPATAVINTDVNIVGRIRNLGTATLNSFTAVYRVNGGEPVSHTFSNLTVEPYKMYNFTPPTPIREATPGTYHVEVTVSKPNGEDDLTYNNTLSQDIEITAENELALNAVTLPAYRLLNEESEIKVAVKNMGNEAITTFTLAYSVNGGESVSHTFTNVNILEGRTINFTHPVKLLANQVQTQSVVVTISNPNGRPDADYNNSKSADIVVYGYAVQRFLLHENFTSSTCAPCAAGNAYLQNFRSQVDPLQWVHISYQMSWPGNGDPYYTLEGGIRRNLYGITSAPYMSVDGIRFRNSPINYEMAKHWNTFRAIPAGAQLSGTAETEGHTISADITVLPATTMSTQDLRLFAVVIENRTEKNKKSNGETEFFNVMKKFLTAPEGDVLDDFVFNVPKTYSLSYSFNGDYRLPSNAYDPIDHAIEHSVENFDNLSVIFWIQNIKTKEVFQAGKASGGTIDIPSTKTDRNALAFIRDGKLNIHSEAALQSVEVYNISGQKQLLASDKEIPVNHWPSGVYLVKIKTSEGDKVVKVIK
ncbi:MAG: T9SS type A sorting domain-containing protein, partial [Candidatus Symbiothrix sp.]|nr:T9SS type A sorting domain-containing protein [Candidatus Symbiothrix sp.]